MNINDYFPILNFLGFLILGFSYIFVQYRYGQNRASVEVIEVYKTQVDQLQKQVSELTSKVGSLEGSLIGKDKQLQETGKDL